MVQGSDAEALERIFKGFGFAEEVRIGRAPGKMSVLGLDFDAIYGETADYEYASEMPEGAPRGR